MTRAGPIPSSETERVRLIWEKLAPKYDGQMGFYDRVLFGDSRRWVCSRAEGNVLELGVGTGRNLDRYPPGARLTGVDFSAPMLELAGLRAKQLGRMIDLRLGDAQALEFPEASFDTVVCTLALLDPR